MKRCRRRCSHRPVGESAGCVVVLRHQDVRVIGEELGYRTDFGCGSGVVALASGHGVLSEPAFGKIAVQVDPSLPVFTALTVAIVVLVFHDDRVTRFVCFLSSSQTDHQAGILVVYNVLAFGIFITESGDVAVSVEVVIPVFVDLAVLVIVFFHAVLPLRDPFFEAVEQSVRIDHRADVKSLIIDYPGDFLIRTVT